MTPPRWNYKAPRSPPRACNSGSVAAELGAAWEWQKTCNLEHRHASYTRWQQSMHAHSPRENIKRGIMLQSQSVIKLQSANFFGLRRWGVTAEARINAYKPSLQAKKCITYEAESMKEQVQHAQGHRNKKESSGKYSLPQKAGLLLSFSLELMVSSFPTGKHRKTNSSQINFVGIYHSYRIIRILVQG